jgi:hypothetical protein
MFQDQCISVTDLRTKTKECLEHLEKEPKYIFINNRPIAVLLDINVYEGVFLKPQLIELGKNEVDETLKKQAEKAKKSKKSDLINI